MKTTRSVLFIAVALLAACHSAPTTTPPVVVPPVVTPPVVVPPVTSTGDVIADRLGKSYTDYDHTGETPFPDQYLRPVIATPAGSYRQQTSEGLGVWSTTSGDFSSTEAQVLYVADHALTVDKTKTPWTINDGIGVARLTVENMSNSSLGIFPQVHSIPDANAYDWIQYNDQPADKIGKPIGQARGYLRWCNGDLILFEDGFVGTTATTTSFCPTGGFLIPPTKKVTNICVTPGNEFTLITCIDIASGKGQLAVVVNWTGKSVAAAAGESQFYHDWPFSYPGLPNPAIYGGFKILGYVDLGINFPTAVSCAASTGSDRVNQADGNAGTLADFDLSIQATRDIFATGNNATYISSWGFAVVISKTENKAVYVDFRAMFAGYREQYTTTQALFDVTRPPAGWQAKWWAAFGLGDTDWPPTFTGKPEWAPVVTATVDVPSPTAVLVCLHGDGRLAVGCEDGFVRFWKGGPADGTTPVSDGSIKAGRNITCLTYDKFPSQYGTRQGGLIAVSRGDRSISFLSDWGPASKVTKTLRDNRLEDPVAAEVADTHGINVGVLTVCDYAGKQVLNYRYTEAEMVNFGDVKFPIQAGADFECTGTLALPGKPISACGTNVN